MTVFDEKKISIHVGIQKKDLIDRHRSNLVEGKCYYIHKFYVTENKEQFKSTKHPLRIVFHFGTQVREAEASIPRYCFSFVDFFEIEIEEHPTEHLVDVIGAMTTCTEVTTYHYYGNQGIKVDFSLENESGDVLKCTIFGDQAQMIYDYVINHDDPVITIVQLGRLKSYRNEMCINSSWNATKVFLNLDIPEVENFPQRPMVTMVSSFTTSTQVDGTNSNSVGESLSMVATKTIKEILEIDQGGRFLVSGTVSEINMNEDWYYKSCNLCRKKVSVVENVFFCTKCNKPPPVVIARYMIHYTVTDETGAADFILFDGTTFQLMKRTAHDLRKQMLSCGEDFGFPKELDNLLGRNFNFVIDVNYAFNIEKKIKSYTVNSLTEIFADAAQFDVNHLSDKIEVCPSINNSETTISLAQSVEVSLFDTPVLTQPRDELSVAKPKVSQISTVALKKGKRKMYIEQCDSIEDVQVDLSNALDEVADPVPNEDDDSDAPICFLKHGRKRSGKLVGDLLTGNASKKKTLKKKYTTN